MTSALLTSILVLTGMACNLGGTPQASPALSILAPAERATPTAAVLSSPAAEPLVVTHLESEFRIYALDGKLVGTRSAGSSLHRYDIATGAISPLAGLAARVTAPCWSDVTRDGSFAVGACGATGEAIERNTASGVETVMPALPDQGQAGAGAYTPLRTRWGYGIARGDPENEAGQVVLVPERGGAPTVQASHAPGAFDVILWIDEERMAAGYWQADQTFVDAISVDGSRQAIGRGRLIGLMRP
jgi:hypothetical protein